MTCNHPTKNVWREKGRNNTQGKVNPRGKSWCLKAWENRGQENVSGTRNKHKNWENRLSKGEEEEKGKRH